tara:strand:- start:2033 stop:2692 length:660 start_codon:yes stop_codon:yes gene_type:complete
MHPKFVSHTSSPYLIFKRISDVILSCFLLFALSPLLFLCALLVYFDLGEPILFTQARAGLYDRKFVIYKFRTMKQVYDQYGSLLRDELRVTPFGRFLRALSLDELPELYNIFIGDMSFVGPRPLPYRYVPLYSDLQRCRHNVLPGLTGLAQVNGRNLTSWDRRFTLDLLYVDKISFFLDYKIMMKTIFVVISSHGVNSFSNLPMPDFTGDQARHNNSSQ